MKMMTFAFASLVSLSSVAADLELPHFNWRLTDISEKGISKEDLFSSMDREHIKLGQSICANRALMWLYSFKKEKEIDGAKVFLFYTSKTGKVGSKRWWYHVAPIINEGGTEYVMDAGFPATIKSPLLMPQWLEKFTGSKTCYEIKPEDRDLIELMNQGQAFPQTTHRGTYDCYTIKVPAGYWFPGTVADNLLGNLKTDEAIQEDDVYEACKEAVTNPVGRIFGSGKTKCRKLIGRAP